MSLLTELFRAFSRYPWEAFTAQADRQVPVSLLEFAEFPEASQRRRADRVMERLADPAARHSANSELYPPLHRLASGKSAGTAEADLRLLELHVGLLDAETLPTFPDGIYRLVPTAGAVFEVAGGATQPLAPQPLDEVPGLCARIYHPYSRLFTDLLSAADYPLPATIPDLSHELRKLAAAAPLLATYSPELSEDFQALITWIALLPASSALLHTSLRLSYFRTIFLNSVGADVDPDVLVERLVHEYIHQRMRQWWFYEPVEGLPDDDVRIVSPFSGLVKPVPVMLQGLLIFIEALRYHTWALSRADRPNDRVSAARVEKMLHTVPPLVAELSRCAPVGSAFARQVRFLDEAFRQAAPQATALVTEIR